MRANNRVKATGPINETVNEQPVVLRIFTDCFLFSDLKKWLIGKKFNNNELPNFIFKQNNNGITKTIRKKLEADDNNLEKKCIFL